MQAHGLLEAVGEKTSWEKLVLALQDGLDDRFLDALAQHDMGELRAGSLIAWL